MLSGLKGIADLAKSLVLKKEEAKLKSKKKTT